MASKYIQKYPIPDGFAEILHDFTREILRDQPEDILSYAAEYFECLHEGKPFKFDSKFNIKKEDQKNIKSHKYQEGYSGDNQQQQQQQQQSKKENQQQQQQSKPLTYQRETSSPQNSQSQKSERAQSQQSKRSGAATSHKTEKDQVKQYMAELSEGLMDLSGLNSSKHEYSQDGSLSQENREQYGMMGRGMTHETIKEVGRDYVQELTGVSQSNEVYKRASQIEPGHKITASQGSNINIQDQQNLITGQFFVNIVAAKNLVPDQEIENEEDLETYCIAMLTHDPTRLIKSDYATGTNPLWNQQDKFLVSLSEEQVADSQLNIQLYDGNKKCLGEVSLECQTQFLNVHKWFNKFVEIKNTQGDVVGSVYLQTLWMEDGLDEAIEVPEPENLLNVQEEEQLQKGIFYINILQAQDLDLAEEEAVELQALAFLSVDPQNYIQTEKYSEDDKLPKWNQMEKLYLSLREEDKTDQQLIVQVRNGKIVIGETSVDAHAALNEGSWLNNKFELTNMKGQPGFGSIKLQAKWVPEGQELGEIPEIEN